MDLVPSNLDLAAAELDLFRNYTRERVLREALKPVADRYDYILIDCPPSLTLLTVNAFVAATEVLKVILAAYRSVEEKRIVSLAPEPVRVG